MSFSYRQLEAELKQRKKQYLVAGAIKRVLTATQLGGGGWGVGGTKNYEPFHPLEHFLWQ